MKICNCEKCDRTFEMPDSFLGRIICEDCDLFMNPTENEQSIAGDSTQRLSFQEIEKEAEKRYPNFFKDQRDTTADYQRGIFIAGAKYAQQQQGGLDGETLVSSSDYAKLQEDYNKSQSALLELADALIKMKKAFEELLASSADRRITWSIDGAHLQKRNEFKNKWLTKAGIVLQEQKEK